MKKWSKEIVDRIKSLYEDHTWDEIAKILKKEFKFNRTPDTIRKTFKNKTGEKVRKKHGSNQDAPKILIFDIETFPIEAYTWSLWQDSIPLNMMIQDWSVLSYSAKWLGGDEIFYEDVQGQKDLRDDSKILKGIWKLLDECDIAVGHNSIAFDTKKLNARFSLNGMQPPSSFKQIDTKRLAKKVFSHTSNKLAYLTDKYCTEYKKLSHGKFPGFKLWEECLKKNPEAFKELKEYNCYDVLSLEELFKKLAPWDNAINYDVYNQNDYHLCVCGAKDSLKKNGFSYTASCKYQRYRCKECGAEWRDKTNLIDKELKKKKKTRAK